MNIMFRLGRMICIIADVLSWPGDRLFWFGDWICFRALYGATGGEDVGQHDNSNAGDASFYGLF